MWNFYIVLAYEEAKNALIYFTRFILYLYFLLYKILKYVINIFVINITNKSHVDTHTGLLRCRSIYITFYMTVQ